MAEVCSKCGLNKALCVCETIAKESQKIVVSVEKAKFGKEHTMIQGIDLKDIDAKELLRDLKNKFACGGTVKDDNIYLQGNHKQRMREELIKLGFAPETIQVK